MANASLKFYDIQSCSPRGLLCLRKKRIFFNGMVMKYGCVSYLINHSEKQYLEGQCFHINIAAKPFLYNSDNGGIEIK